MRIVVALTVLVYSLLFRVSRGLVRAGLVALELEGTLFNPRHNPKNQAFASVKPASGFCGILYFGQTRNFSFHLQQLKRIV